MTNKIRIQSDSNAHDGPWRVAVEQGFFAAEGLEVEHFQDSPDGVAIRAKDFPNAGRRPSFRRARWRSIRFANGARSSASRRSAAARSSGSTRRSAPARRWCARIRRSRAWPSSQGRADRRHLACGHVLCGHRGARGRRRRVPGHQAGARQRPARGAAVRRDRSRRADGAAGQPRPGGGRPPAHQPALAGGIVAGNDVDQQTARKGDPRAQPCDRLARARTRSGRARNCCGICSRASAPVDCCPS